MTYLTDIERLNYYEGEFLGAVDFQAEQEYHRDMRRRHNLGQHTFGIVTGLELAQAPNGGTDGSNVDVDVYLQPGMAVDGLGREIVVLNQVQLTADMFAAFYSPNPGSSPVLLYIWIGYEEQLLEPSADACTSANVANAYARTEETYTLVVTATRTPPPGTAIVVDGVQVSPPTEPSSSSSSSSGTTIVTDPPQITIPYDGSVPYQEFSDDDSTLNWWVPLGRVKWDPYNQVFLQIVPNDPTDSATSANFGRLYVGNVSETAYAPAGLYYIVDRNSPYPAPPSSSDPNLGGVQAEVAGSLQVDYLLNAETSAVIGGLYDPNTMSSLSPLNIVATTAATNQQLVQFFDPNDNPTWYINQEFDGSTLGLNIGEVTGTGAHVDNRIFIQPTQSSGSGPSTQNVGIGTATPEQSLTVNTGLNIDEADSNTGTLAQGPWAALTFGRASGEGIGSCRQGSTNLHGLDFYTGFNKQMSIDHSGNVVIAGNLSVAGAFICPNKTGCVEDRFINRDGIALERGDVVVLHPTPSSLYYGSTNQIPIVEVRLTDTVGDTRVCGIVDEPELADARISDLSRAKIGNVKVGVMVTLGAFAYCKVDADVAPVAPGDLLVTSSTPGHAQKLDPNAAPKPGAIIGKALGALASGKGLIPVIISHQ